MTGYTIVLLVVHLGLLAVGAWLIVIDARTHRLPNRIVLPTGAVTLVLAAVDALVRGDAEGLLRGALGLLLLGGFYAVLHLAGGGVGGGDVKLAAVIGFVLAWQSWNALVLGAAAAFVLGALWALLLMALRRAGRRTRIAFGPWMVGGAVIGVLGAGPGLW